MPATIVIVYDNRKVRSAAVLAIRAAGHDVAAFADPMTALSAVEKDSRVRVLVSRIDFGPGQLNGVALAQMLRVKQITQDGTSRLRPVFLDRPDNGHHATGIGAFVPMPLDAQTLVAAIGIALARPHDKVIALLGDGSIMYAIQGLWTAAQLGLGVTFVVIRNRRYEALHEFGRHFGLQRTVGTQLPDIDFCALARGHGVAPSRVDHPAALDTALRSAFAERARPTLVEIAVD